MTSVAGWAISRARSLRSPAPRSCAVDHVREPRCCDSQKGAPTRRSASSARALLTRRPAASPGPGSFLPQRRSRSPTATCSWRSNASKSSNRPRTRSTFRCYTPPRAQPADGSLWPRASRSPRAPCCRMLSPGGNDSQFRTRSRRPARCSRRRSATSATPTALRRRSRLHARSSTRWAASRVVATLEPARLPEPRPGGLTSRESEVLALVARGLSNKEIRGRTVAQCEDRVASPLEHLRQDRRVESGRSDGVHVPRRDRRHRLNLLDPAPRVGIAVGGSQ